jgi:hypothetical protein
VTTSGSYRLFSARSIAAVKATGALFLIIGTDIILTALAPHTEQMMDSGASPIGRLISITPSCWHWYSYVAISFLPIFRKISLNKNCVFIIFFILSLTTPNLDSLKEADASKCPR